MLNFYCHKFHPNQEEDLRDAERWLFQEILLNQQEIIRPLGATSTRPDNLEEQG